MKLIEFKDVKKAFGKNTILDGMNLSINEGETITIMGGSGSGKSVTLKLLLKLIDIDEGQIFFKGESIYDMNEEHLLQMRRQVSMLFQSGALFDSMTVFDNVAYPLREQKKYEDHELVSLVAEKLELVGLGGVEKMYPADLSGGMRKRVGLARAIATSPEVILYDEPTTGLDPSNTHRISLLIRELQKKLKLTSIVVTHDMQSAFMVSDRLALLYDKKIRFVGSVDEVKNSKDEVVSKFINGEMEENNPQVRS